MAARPAPKLPANVAKRSQARPAPASPRGRAAFVPGKVVDRGKANPPASRDRSARNANHPASRANRARPQALNQVIAGSNVNSNNRATNVNNISNVSNRTSLYTNNHWGNQWTNNRTSIWNRHRVVNNRPVYISPNFQRSYNYAYRPVSWGSRPWWSSPTYHTWHRGSWNYGWNRTWRTHHYHRPYFPGYRSYDPGRSFAWGLAAWTLGSLAYDTGYYSYRNPYQAPPVRTRTTVINYTQPLSVVASREEPEPEEVALTAQEQSTLAMERARAEFADGDYLAALQSTDEAISHAASDTALHEFRALCLFALGRYGDAAGVLNPVLASGPGWDWETMAAFYPDADVYTGQLRKLETYVESNTESPDAHFVLGYHYLVAGYIDESFAMFDQVVTLQPNDRVAVQLRNLAESSSPNAEEEDPEVATSVAEPAPSDIPEVAVEPIEPTDLEGGWKAASTDGKSITLTLDPAGTFTWNYEGADQGKVLEGDWSIDEESRLVLASTDVQMVADTSLDGDTLLFVLAGSPVGDPGLSFERLSP